jgi:hypothetical protein
VFILLFNNPVFVSQSHSGIYSFNRDTLFLNPYLRNSVVQFSIIIIITFPSAQMLFSNSVLFSNHYYVTHIRSHRSNKPSYAPPEDGQNAFKHVVEDVVKHVVVRKYDTEETCVDGK